MKWMRPEDVRAPVTATEAEAALDMIDVTTVHDQVNKQIPGNANPIVISDKSLPFKFADQVNTFIAN